MDKEVVKSRRERRKEARLAKQQHRLQSWVQHQALKKQRKRKSVPLSSHKVAAPHDNGNLMLDKKYQKTRNSVKLESKSSRKLKIEESTAKQSKTKFHEYLETEKYGAVVSADEDLALEMRLAKKLKVKEGRVSGPGDAINDLLDGISIHSNSLEVEGHHNKLGLEPEQDKEDITPVKKSKTIKKKSKLNAEQPKNSKTRVTPMKKPQTKFEEYLEMEGHKKVSADEDLAVEMRLAKKLKVKGGKLGGSDDGMNDLMEGIFSYDDIVGTKHHDECIVKGVNQVLIKMKKKRKELIDCSVHRRSPEPLEKSPSTDAHNEDQCFPGGNEFSNMPMEEDTALFHDAMDGQETSTFSSEQEELEQSEVCVGDTQGDDSDGKSLKAESLGINCAVSERGGGNAKTEQMISAVNATAKYVAPHLRSDSTIGSNEYAQIRRHIRGLLNKLSELNVESIVGEISAIFQSHGRHVGTQIVGDEVLASCSGGPRGNEQYAAVFAAFAAGIAASVGMDFGAKLFASLATSFEEEYRKGDSLALRNLTLLLAYLYKFGLCSSDLIYDLLALLSKRLEELDVSTILTILQCCGMGLRSDDPVAMKDFVLCIQQQVQELKALSSGTQDGKPKISGKRMEFMLETICEIKNNKRRPKEESIPHNRLKKWLQKLRVENVQLRGIKWVKLLDPSKKGQWWIFGDINTVNKDNAAGIANAIDTEVAEAQKMLQLASAQRMNTEARRAIFCIIMSGEDYLDAFEKILRLNLPGKQDREILRVLVECCLQEVVFNKYYSLLAAKLCHHDKNHKFTLQYCLWDHFKQLDSMELRRVANLARFLADLIGSFSLSLAVLKAVDFSDSMVMTPKVVMHFRILFETLFTQYSDAVIWNIFTRIASPPELESLRIGLELFILQQVNKNALAGAQIVPSQSASVVVNKFKVAKKALVNVAGILM